MKILVIEDERGIRENLKELLELNGHSVSVAEDGPKGILSAQNRPDLILCDIGLPGIDGYSVISTIRSLPNCKETPFIFLTARAEREDMRKGMNLGADDYITKPFRAGEVLDAVAARMKRQHPLLQRVESLLNERQHEQAAEWSHELLTPLNGILGGLELLEMEIDSTDKQQIREIISLIRMGAERQFKLAMKLIRHFELQTRHDQKIPFPPGVCDAERAVALGIARAEAIEARRNEVHLHSTSLLTPIPEIYLSEAVTELVGNALRFSKPGQLVHVTVHKSDSCVQITIRDQGRGMTPDQRQRIAAFTQFDRELYQQQGLGLGLAIVANIAAIAQGRLILSAPPDGPGLLVSLYLPCAQA